MKRNSVRFIGRNALVTIAAATCVIGVAIAAVVGTTAKDFEQPGTQPNALIDDILASDSCAFCHGGYDPEDAPYDRWAGTMMANSMRDPVFHAALAIAEQDAGASGELCLRCHSPGGWLEGRSTPTDGSAMADKDYDGVNCNFCHRMVDPVADAANPSFDADILAGLAEIPSTSHNGQYIVDPEDRRRGPFDPEICNLYHPFTSQSPYHEESLLCGTCHEVSNPAYSRVGGPIPASTDTYALNTLDAAHPTQNPYDEFPLERTYSEWFMSDFGAGPVEMGGLFGGNKTAVSTCQDCHMPDTTGTGCFPSFGAPVRDDLPQHDFAGVNSWVPLAVYDLDQSGALYGSSEASGQPLTTFQESVARNISMLERASELALSLEGGALNVRVTNNGGHKLPTGYPEGRRMWINVEFFDAGGALLEERGAYDQSTATLTHDTKIYEVELGPDAALAPTVGLPEEPSFHFVLNNKVYKDNRIPPRGFTNAGFESVQAKPVGADYADGQYWDDTLFDVPCGAASATVNVYHQTTSREYIEFLRDNNTTNNAGQIAYDQWVLHGKSAPVLMESETLTFGPRLGADVSEISTAVGGVQTLCVDAGVANAGRLYWVLGTLTGTTPGFGFGGFTIPLNFDTWTVFTIQSPNTAQLGNTFGTLDPAGQATATITIPALPALAGFHADHAYGVLTGAVLSDVSNPVGLDLLP